MRCSACIRFSMSQTASRFSREVKSLDGAPSAMKPRIKLPREWIDRSQLWAERSVLGYERGEKENSRRYARPGIDRSVSHQFLGRAAECAFCLFLGIDPGADLDWSPRPDLGWDVERFGLRIDVKGTRTAYLMWPVTKNGFLYQCEAHVFALVRQIEPDLYEMSGWLTLQEFIDRHHDATAQDRLDEGTKFLHARELPDIENLCNILAVRQPTA